MENRNISSLTLGEIFKKVYGSNAEALLAEIQSGINSNLKPEEIRENVKKKATALGVTNLTLMEASFM